MAGNEEKFKKRIYEIIESSRGNDRASKLYDTMILVAIFIGLVPMTMKTANEYTRLIDLITVIIFLVDYIFRFYTSDYKMGVKSYKAYFAYLITPLAIIDFLSIVPILAFFLPANKYLGIFRLFRILLAFRALRVLKLIRYSKTMISLANVGRRVKKPLTAVLILTLIYISICGLIMFQIEPDLFGTCFDALYWATISITSIGYGDIAPVTAAGRFITILSSLIGVAVIALPSGIITAAYIEEIKKKKTKLEL